MVRRVRLLHQPGIAWLGLGLELGLRLGLGLGLGLGSVLGLGLGLVTSGAATPDEARGPMWLLGGHRLGRWLVTSPRGCVGV